MKHRAPLIGVLVALVLVAGYWFGLYKPALEEQAAFEEETAELEGLQSQLRAEIVQLEAIRDDEEHIRAVVARQEEFLPTGVAQPAVVRQLQQAADASEVEITSVTFGEPTVVVGAPDTGDPATTLSSIAISMVTQGRYFPTVDFFRRVEQEVPRAVLTQSVNLNEGDDGYPSLATTWSGQLFAVVPVAATVDPDDPRAAPGGVAPDAEQPEGADEPADPAATARGDEEGPRS